MALIFGRGQQELSQLQQPRIEVERTRSGKLPTRPADALARSCAALPRAGNPAQPADRTRATACAAPHPFPPRNTACGEKRSRRCDARSPRRSTAAAPRPRPARIVPAEAGDDQQRLRRCACPCACVLKSKRCIKCWRFRIWYLSGFRVSGLEFGAALPAPRSRPRTVTAPACGFVRKIREPRKKRADKHDQLALEGQDRLVAPLRDRAQRVLGHLDRRHAAHVVERRNEAFCSIMFWEKFVWREPGANHQHIDAVLGTTLRTQAPGALKPSTANLLAEYSLRAGMPRLPAIDEMLIDRRPRAGLELGGWRNGVVLGSALKKLIPRRFGASAPGSRRRAQCLRRLLMPGR